MHVLRAQVLKCDCIPWSPVLPGVSCGTLAKTVGIQETGNSNPSLTGRSEDWMRHNSQANWQINSKHLINIVVIITCSSIAPIFLVFPECLGMACMYPLTLKVTQTWLCVGNSCSMKEHSASFLIPSSSHLLWPTSVGESDAMFENLMAALLKGSSTTLQCARWKDIGCIFCLSQELAIGSNIRHWDATCPTLSGAIHHTKNCSTFHMI